MQTLLSIPMLAALTCPQVHVDLEIHTYAGTEYLTLCTTPGGFQYIAPNMYLSLYDPSADGIFHNGFDQEGHNAGDSPDPEPSTPDGVRPR